MTTSVHKIYVDSSPKGQVRWFDETTGEIGKHRLGKGRSVHEAELSAVAKALEDALSKVDEGDKLELYCDREVVVKQLNHEAGISEKQVLALTDKIWSMSYRAKHDKRIDVRFLWVSRKKNPAGKMLGV
jgi:ribonuclease HI